MESKQMKLELSEAAKEARRAYNREYYAKHKDAVKKRRMAFWERKAAALRTEE